MYILHEDGVRKRRVWQKNYKTEYIANHWQGEGGGIIFQQRNRMWDKHVSPVLKAEQAFVCMARNLALKILNVWQGLF